MKLRATIQLIALTALAPLALANFDVYMDHYKTWDHQTKTDHSFRVFSGAETGQSLCGLVNNKDYKTWDARDDVSHRHFGIRCAGGGCTWDTADPNSVTAFEMHFSNVPDYHWTFYANNKKNDLPPAGAPFGKWMYTATKFEYSPGYCFPYPGDSYNCEHEAPEGPKGATFVVGSRGKRMFRCVTTGFGEVGEGINSDRINKPVKLENIMGGTG